MKTKRKEDKPYHCPKCRETEMYIVVELEKHGESENEGYEVAECYHCHTYYKIYWRFFKRTELKETKNK